MNTKVPINRKVVLPIAAGLSMIYYWWVAIYPLNPGRQIAQLQACWNRGDFGCVANVASESELEAYEISRQELANFLKVYADPILRQGLEFSRNQLSDHDQGVMLKWSDDTGRAQFSSLAVLQNRQLILPDFVTNVLIQTASKKFSDGTDTEISSLECSMRQADQDGPQLEALGIKGFAQTSKLKTWDRWSKGCKRLIAMWKAQNKTSG